MSVKTANVGHFTIPTAPAAGTSVTSGAANVFTTTYVQLIASTAAALFITGIYVEEAAVTAATYIVVQLATGGAGSETIIGQYLVAPQTGSTVTRTYRPIFPPIPVANATRIAAKTADSVGAAAKLITLECIAQSNVVDGGIVESANVTQLLGTAWLTPAVAGTPDVNAKQLGGTNQTGRDVGASVLLSAGSGAGQLDFTSGVVKANLAQILGTALTETAGLLAGGFKKFFNIASPTGTLNSLPDAVPGAAGGLLVDDVWTDARAAKLDNLDAAVTSRMATYTQPTGFLATTFPSGTVAASSEVTAIQNNTNVVRTVPQVIERPDSGTTTYRVEVFLYDETGNMEAPDSAPTLTLVNQSGTDRSSRLDSTTMALISTGRYRVIYTADAADTLEQLTWVFSVVEGGATRLYGNQSIIVDTTAVDFTAADRTKLDTLHDTRIPGVIQPQTGDAYARIGANGAGLTALGDARIANLDAAVSSRLAAASYTAPDNADIVLIKAKTDNLPAAPAAVSDIPTAVQNADALLKRDWLLVTGEASRSVLNALRFVRNKFLVGGGIVSIYAEDDTTVVYTKSVTTDPDAEPIISG